VGATNRLVYSLDVHAARSLAVLPAQRSASAWRFRAVRSGDWIVMDVRNDGEGATGRKGGRGSLDADEMGVLRG
jgi:hypothetical protein